MWIAAVLIAGILVGCGSNNGSDSIGESTREETLNTELSTHETTELLTVDLFEGVYVVCQGWDALGKTVEINAEACDGFVKENVTFSFAEDYSNLTNRDYVTVIAEYDKNSMTEQGVVPISDTKEFRVEGLREIVSAQDFHDGLAWVEVEVGDRVNWCCCDMEGNIRFSLEDGQKPTTYFANGVSIVDNKMLVNDQGEVVWSAEKEGINYVNEMWGEGTSRGISLMFDEDEGEEYFGYTYARFYIECFEFTGSVTGVINPDGSWRITPNEEFYKGSYKEAGFYWCPSSGVDCYNIIYNTGISNQYSERYKEYYQSVVAEYELEKHDGLIFKWKSYPDTSGFYNAEGEEVIDLSKYNIDKYDEPEFYEGYALLEIENDQGYDYYTIIDSSGNEMFSPQKAVEHGALRYGYYWVDDVGYMNVYGEPAFELFCLTGRDFCEGMAFVYSSGYHFINTSGEIVF